MIKHYKKTEKSFFFTLIFGLLAFTIHAQESMPGKTIVCYASAISNPVHIVPAKNNLRVQKTLATIEVTYEGFPESAKIPFQYAIDIWKGALSSTVPIRINAKWTSLSSNTLASTQATKLFRSFEGAIQPDIWYPVALAEKIAKKDLNSTTESDIEISVNKDSNWYLGTNGNPSNNQLDLVSVILHEIAHGLGFTSSGEVDNNKGILRDENYILIYDLLLENSSSIRLSTFPNASQSLYSQLTSNKVFLHSPSAAEALKNKFPKVYAPFDFQKGSSISHLDESAFPKGDSNSLMSPSFSPGESIHLLGKVVLGVLGDIGWSKSSEESYKVIVYPNPSTGIYNLQLPVNINNIEIKVVDPVGREVWKVGGIAVKKVINQIDLSILSNGLYTLVISTPGRKISRQIILSK